jgi:hypothetical protein
VIHDPEVRGQALADFFLEVEPRLFADLGESVTLARGSTAPLDRLEWACFALYACVRGLVAAGGFNRETATAVDALHDRVLEAWESGASGEPFAATGAARARVADRYAEYGAIGQEGGASGAATVTARLGMAAAGHVAGDPAPPGFAERIGAAGRLLSIGHDQEHQEVDAERQQQRREGDPEHLPVRDAGAARGHVCFESRALGPARDQEQRRGISGRQGGCRPAEWQEERQRHQDRRRDRCAEQRLHPGARTAQDPEILRQHEAAGERRGKQCAAGDLPRRIELSGQRTIPIHGAQSAFEPRRNRAKFACHREQVGMGSPP